MSAVHMAPSSLAGLRALAAAGAAKSPPPLPAASSAAPLRQPRRSRAAALAVTVEMNNPGYSIDTEEPSTSGRQYYLDGSESQRQLAHSVRVLLDGGRPAVAAHLLQEEWALTSRCLEDPALSQELLLQLIEQVNTSAALGVLPMLTASTRMYCQGMHALAARGSLRGVRALLDHACETHLAEGPKARDIWRAAIVAFGSLKRPQDARQAFVGMRAAGAWSVDDTATVNLLLNALHTQIELQFVRCNQLWREGVVPDTSTFNCLLKACMRARDARRAGLAMTWMRQAGAPADEITYNTLIKVYSYASDFDGVLGVWRSMEAAGFTPTPKLWGSLLVACSAAGQLEQAAIFWWEMKQLHSEQLLLLREQEAQQQQLEQQGQQPPQQQQRGRKQRGVKRGGTLTTDNVCAMMTACNDAGQYERALTVFTEAKTLGVPMDTRAYNIALKACHTPGKTLRQEQLIQAFSIYDELKRVGLPPDAFTFGTLFSLCAAARQGHCALQLYAEMHERGVKENVVAMTALLKAVGSSSGPGMAHECLRIFRRMMHGPARVKPNQSTYRTVIAALREQGALAEALRVYQSMRRVYPADNSEFEGLTAVAAERALAAEDAELRTAVADVCQISSCREVDLHGMSVLEARAAVLCVLAMLQQQFKDSGGRLAHDVTIITGRGLGSEGGEPVVRNEVLRLLDRLHMSLPPEALCGNPGRIVIPQRLLVDTLRKKMQAQQMQQQAQQAETQQRQQPDGSGSEGSFRKQPGGCGASSNGSSSSRGGSSGNRRKQ